VVRTSGARATSPLSKSFTISVDAMGGDNAPNMVVEGINLNLARHPGVRFLLFGREWQLRPLLDRYPNVQSVAEIRDTTDVVGSGERPSVALRTGRTSSMRKAIDAVGSGEADAIVSAGNTGALMAMAKFVLKTLPGVDRPAIATVIAELTGEKGASLSPLSLRFRNNPGIESAIPSAKFIQCY